MFCTAYLDDIFIYSDTLEDNKNHVWLILQALTNAGVFLRAEKWQFHFQETKYLGPIIFKDGIKMVLTKVDTVRNWEPPEKFKNVQAFLRFTNFYQDSYWDILKLWQH